MGAFQPRLRAVPRVSTDVRTKKEHLVALSSLNVSLAWPVMHLRNVNVIERQRVS
jgi:hypothetical protein